MKKEFDQDNPYVVYHSLSLLASNAALNGLDFDGYLFYLEQAELFERKAKIWEMLRGILEKSKR